MHVDFNTKKRMDAEKKMVTKMESIAEVNEQCCVW